MSIEIKSRFTGEIIRLIDAESLVNADLKGANLEGADLEGANLKWANLKWANLKGANLEGADLKWADLEGANLKGANLKWADLEGANLKGADLEGANLKGANLKGANLEPVKNDMWVVLLQSIPEIPALKMAIKEGRINGSTYSGPCSCLAGTVAKARGVTHSELGYANAYRPIERFFLGIQEGDTPENNEFSKLALAWIEEFEALIAPPVAQNRAIEKGENIMSNEVNIPENQVTDLKEGEDIQPHGEGSTSDAGDAPESTPSEVSAPAEGEPVTGATEASEEAVPN